MNFSSRPKKPFTFNNPKTKEENRTHSNIERQNLKKYRKIEHYAREKKELQPFLFKNSKELSSTKPNSKFSTIKKPTLTSKSKSSNLIKKKKSQINIQKKPKQILYVNLILPDKREAKIKIFGEESITYSLMKFCIKYSIDDIALIEVLKRKIKRDLERIERKSNVFKSIEENKDKIEKNERVKTRRKRSNYTRESSAGSGGSRKRGSGDEKIKGKKISKKDKMRIIRRGSNHSRGSSMKSSGSKKKYSGDNLYGNKKIPLRKKLKSKKKEKKARSSLMLGKKGKKKRIKSSTTRNLHKTNFRKIEDVLTKKRNFTVRNSGIIDNKKNPREKQALSLKESFTKSNKKIFQRKSVKKELNKVALKYLRGNLSGMGSRKHSSNTNSHSKINMSLNNRKASLNKIKNRFRHRMFGGIKAKEDLSNSIENNRDYYSEAKKKDGITAKVSERYQMMKRKREGLFSKLKERMKSRKKEKKEGKEINRDDLKSEKKRLFGKRRSSSIDDSSALERLMKRRKSKTMSKSNFDARGKEIEPKSNFMINAYSRKMSKELDEGEDKNRSKEQVSLVVSRKISLNTAEKLIPDTPMIRKLNNQLGKQVRKYSEKEPDISIVKIEMDKEELKKIMLKKNVSKDTDEINTSTVSKEYVNVEESNMFYSHQVKNSPNNVVIDHDDIMNYTESPLHESDAKSGLKLDSNLIQSTRKNDNLMTISDFFPENDILRKIFGLMDSDLDGFISPEKLNFESIPTEMLEYLEVILFEVYKATVPTSYQDYLRIIHQNKLEKKLEKVKKIFNFFRSILLLS